MRRKLLRSRETPLQPLACAAAVAGMRLIPQPVATNGKNAGNLIRLNTDANSDIGIPLNALE
jgi:hypothetical protein